MWFQSSCNTLMSWSKGSRQTFIIWKHMSSVRTKNQKKYRGRSTFRIFKILSIHVDSQPSVLHHYFFPAIYHHLPLESGIGSSWDLSKTPAHTVLVGIFVDPSIKVCKVENTFQVITRFLFLNHQRCTPRSTSNVHGKSLHKTPLRLSLATTWMIRCLERPGGNRSQKNTSKARNKV